MSSQADGAAMLRVGIAQYAAVPDDPRATEARALAAIDQLAAQAATLAVLPELCASQYFPVTRDEVFFSLAKAPDDPFIQAACARARQHAMAVLLPVFERATEGVYYNSVLAISTDGQIVDRYRKTHIPAVKSFEKYYFRPGASLRPLRGLPGPIGCLICQDRFFPEAAREHALQGARVLVMVNASADYAGFSRTWAPVNQARAYENGCYVIATNRCGDEGATHFFGRSMVVAPGGDILAEAGAGPVSLVADIDLGETARWRHRLQMYRDYRPELYRTISRFDAAEWSEWSEDQ